MMAVIIYNQYALLISLDLQPPLHSLKTGQGIGNHCKLNLQLQGNGYGCQRIVYSMTTRTVAPDTAKFPAVVEECAETRKVHPISTYAYNLASMFNIFYIMRLYPEKRISAM